MIHAPSDVPNSKHDSDTVVFIDTVKRVYRRSALIELDKKQSGVTVELTLFVINLRT